MISRLKMISLTPNERAALDELRDWAGRWRKALYRGWVYGDWPKQMSQRATADLEILASRVLAYAANSKALGTRAHGSEYDTEIKAAVGDER